MRAKEAEERGAILEGEKNLFSPWSSVALFAKASFATEIATRQNWQ